MPATPAPPPAACHARLLPAPIRVEAKQEVRSRTSPYKYLFIRTCPTPRLRTTVSPSIRRCPAPRVDAFHVKAGATVRLLGRLRGRPQVGIKLGSIRAPLRNQAALDHAVDLGRLQILELDHRIDSDRDRRVIQDHVDLHRIGL